MIGALVWDDPWVDIPSIHIILGTIFHEEPWKGQIDSSLSISSLSAHLGHRNLDDHRFEYLPIQQWAAIDCLQLLFLLAPTLNISVQKNLEIMAHTLLLQEIRAKIKYNYIFLFSIIQRTFFR